MVTIAVDAMGGDKAPVPEVEGAIHAARQYGHRVLLVGDKVAVQHELDSHPAARQLPIEVVHAPERITMNDHAAKAARSKRESSMHVCARLVATGSADGFISAGNTGACMAIAKMVLGKLPGVSSRALRRVPDYQRQSRGGG
jgi:glycerol-3-phosphate acyltransferase PlsX